MSKDQNEKDQNDTVFYSDPVSLKESSRWRKN